MPPKGRLPRTQSLHERKQPLDTYDVCEWFATNPAACISDASAQRILRAYEHPFRWWIKFPGKDEELSIRAVFEKPARIHLEQRFAAAGKRARTAAQKQIMETVEKGVRIQMQIGSSAAAQALVNDQSTSWWQSLRNYLSHFIPTQVTDRFTDYLTGFLLVQENETPRSSATWKNRRKGTNTEWRKAKKFLITLNGGCDVPASMLPASTDPPHQESLKTKLIHVMSDELTAVGYPRKRIAEKYLPPTWDAIGERIRVSSFLRAERRSRRRTR